MRNWTTAPAHMLALAAFVVAATLTGNSSSAEGLVREPEKAEFSCDNSGEFKHEISYHASGVWFESKDCLCDKDVKTLKGRALELVSEKKRAPETPLDRLVNHLTVIEVDVDERPKEEKLYCYHLSVIEALAASQSQ